MSAGPGNGLEIWQGIEREIYFAGRPAKLVTIDFLEKVIWQIPLFNHFDERKPRIDTRRNNVGIDLVSARQHHALGFTVFHDDLRNRCLSADFHSGLARRVRDRIGNGAGAAAGKPPRAESTVDFSHVVM